MLILGIETSAKACSAALCRDGEVLAQSYERTGLTHSRTLLPMIEHMLARLVYRHPHRHIHRQGPLLGT